MNYRIKVQSCQVSFLFFNRDTFRALIQESENEALQNSTLAQQKRGNPNLEFPLSIFLYYSAVVASSATVVPSSAAVVVSSAPVVPSSATVVVSSVSVVASSVANFTNAHAP